MMTEDAQSNLQTSLRDMLWGFMISQAVYVAAKFAIFDLLGDVPKTSVEIADSIGAHEPSLRRLLLALTTVNLLTENNGQFVATRMGEQLRSDHPQSWRPFALTVGWPVNWKPWGELEHTILTGKPAFDHVHAIPFFEYFEQHPQDSAAFNAAMTSLSNNDLRAILAAYDFSGFTKIVDVGGGHGLLLCGILERYSQAQGVLCDLPSVVENAYHIRNTAVEARCEVVGVDMFQSVPAGGDVYILKSILHDWNDDESVQILRNCRQAISTHGKLLHIGEVIKPSNEPDFAKWLDLNMLVQLTGRERTEPEFRELYAKAGFRLTQVIPTEGPTIVEGVPI
jgi:hypothetical protein